MVDGRGFRFKNNLLIVGGEAVAEILGLIHRVVERLILQIKIGRKRFGDIEESRERICKRKIDTFSLHGMMTEFDRLNSGGVESHRGLLIGGESPIGEWIGEGVLRKTVGVEL